MAKEKSLADLFYDTLKDICFAERQILRALRKMARAAQSKELKAGFEKHREQTEGHVERPQEVFGRQARSGQDLRGYPRHHCRRRRDHRRIQRVGGYRCRSHFLGAGGGALRDRPLRHAEDLGKKDVVALLDETLQEETATDKTLSQFAATAANQKAAA
ncbi:Ferritin-like metal-binding protein YciE [Rhizobium tibeticum]|uniref:Ferritin-like metal-binding protein YciE n=1 Tax=Rhizobium tibeticum TaxID=501024 RepID=A0A1H8E6K4_9HYPH|nr:hypothetical protein RTCCBAU85039_1124 [Rhizobium tibeticum]SEN14428.1 Ferritin-like metal-binding protein YciE [Rhizobium tibeticum]